VLDNYQYMRIRAILHAWKVSIYFTTVLKIKYGIIVTYQYNYVIIFGIDIAINLTNDFRERIIRKLLQK